MARSGAVWGIDVGQCALKALRCRATSAQDKIEAEAFDYIEYPKILSQPDANPVELVEEALKQFLSRNVVRGDSVAISVSGQAGLARFIKLPPMEAKKIPNIVRYEAKQQIPFDLNDVIWDYQRLGLGTEEEGFVLETEIGLFAMKREAVFRALEPFRKLGIEVDYIQLTPLALYNYLLFDQLRNLPPPEEYDPENPPESVVILSLGTDATDLVITNGYRVWQRSIPIGGNHFTKALTKEMKLTFAKAEHLKRNATAAADPKAVFQAMRPVFNDLLVQLQRSLGYFSNLDRAAKISRIVALGNAMKLPGLRRYLVQSLGYEIERVESFRGLVGSQVLSSPVFKENVICYGVCYGLALQGLGKSGIYTNLLPKEIVHDRLIKQKKPWAVAAVASLLLACGISFGAYSLTLGSVDAARWKQAADQAKQVTETAKGFESEANSAISQFNAINQIGQHLIGNVEGRSRWLELMKAINECLPRDELRGKLTTRTSDKEGVFSLPDEHGLKVNDVVNLSWVDKGNKTRKDMAVKSVNGNNVTIADKAEGKGDILPDPSSVVNIDKQLNKTDPASLRAELTSRNRLYVTNLECQYCEDVSTWFSNVKKDYQGPDMGAESGGQTAGTDQNATGGSEPTSEAVYSPSGPDQTGDQANSAGPQGPGWIVKIEGHHFHNVGHNIGAQFVRNTLIENLINKKIELPDANGKMETYTMRALGITYPVLLEVKSIVDTQVSNPFAGTELVGIGGGRTQGIATGETANYITLPCFNFVVHFCWQPKTPSQRLAAKAEAKNMQAAAGEEQAPTQP
jgi:type IV pilus assembly protein PilM